jgi:hypothetical protein
MSEQGVESQVITKVQIDSLEKVEVGSGGHLYKQGVITRNLCLKEEQ